MANYGRKIAGVQDASDLYYNILIKNNNTGYDSSGNATVNNVSTKLIFDEMRAQPYLDKPSDYFVSLLTFQVDSIRLPVFIAEPIAGSTDINDTLYFYTITDGNDAVILHNRIKWKPQNVDAPLPPSPVPSDYTKYPYYFCYDYQYFLNLINEQVAQDFITAGLTQKPFSLVYNKGNITCIGDKDTYRTNFQGYVWYSVVNPLKIYFNTELYYLFSSLPSIYGFNPNVNVDYQILMNINPSGLNMTTVYTDLTTSPPSSPYTAIQNKSEYNPLAWWSPIDSIIFTSSFLYIVPELISANSSYGLSGLSDTANANQFYILSDYKSPEYGGNNYQPILFYEPVAEYRLSDLYGQMPISQLQIVVYWKDLWGVLHDFYLESEGMASLKLLFRKKIFYE